MCPGVPRPLQVVDHAVGRLVPVVRLLLQQMHDDARQRCRDRWVHVCRWCRHPGQVVMDQPQRVSGSEWRRARRQLIQCRAQRVQIRPLIHRVTGPAGLLWRQIRQRPNDFGVMRELRAHFGERRRQGEVHQARGAIAGEHDVGGGDVPVDYPSAVHSGDRLRQSYRQPDQISGSRGRPRRGQAGAAGVFQHDRPRVPRRLRQLCHPRDTAKPPQDGHFMPQPVFRVRPQWLLADNCALSEKQPGHPRALALVHGLDPVRGVPARQHPPCLHPVPPGRFS